MLRKVFIGFCIIVVLGGGCNQVTANSTAVVQQSPPTNTSTSQPTATTTSTLRQTATKTLTPKPTLKPVGELPQQAEFRVEFYTPTPSRTPTATPTNTFTPTPEPVAPLVAHEWTTEPILLRFGQIGGDGADPLDYSLPSLILYSDGTLIYRERQEINDDTRVKLRQASLSRQKICALFNTIDQTGFFDYDPVTYLPEGEYLPFDGASNTVIEVNAWRSKQISLDGLWVFLNDEPSMARAIVFGGPGTVPYIPAALRDTYKILSHFKVDSAITYQPNHLAIRIDYAMGYAHGQSWPLTTIKMIDLYNRSNSGRDMVITKGAESIAIYQAFDGSMTGGIFEDDTHVFWIGVRPLLPYEQPDFDYSYNAINAPVDFRRSMNCDPADGTLPVP